MIENRELKTKVLRLIHPQWHGGILENWMPKGMEEGIEEAYKIGAGVQNMMIPAEEKGQVTVTIPLSAEITSSNRGAHSEYDDILKQTKVVSDIILEKAPERIVTLAGDASATVIPLGYLNGYYQKDTSLVWIDANPDVSVPYTMALMAWLGKRSEDFKRLWPTMVPASRILIVGYRAWNQSLKEWQDDLGMKGISPLQVAEDSNLILDWLKEKGKKKVYVHLDLSVLDPSELFTSHSSSHNGIKAAQVVRVVNDIAAAYDLVGMTVVEPTPKLVNKVRDTLSQLPLF
ncbi:MAG: arginase family protein [Bacteroidaceae bacterium]|nr:arginase family protein [Bacteroidaceae bacterium]